MLIKGYVSTNISMENESLICKIWAGFILKPHTVLKAHR